MKLYSILILTSFVDCINGYKSERMQSRADAEATTKTNSASFRGARLDLDYEGGEPAEDDIMQVLVRYKDNDSKLNVLAAASEVVEDVEDDNLVIVKMTQASFESIRYSGQVKAEIDNKVEAFEVIHEDAPISINQRNLVEEVPWGIEMIQADQLNVGSFDVPVCIVDTGYAQGHPDLPTDTTGTSTPARNFAWNEDLNGHGTHVAGIMAAVGGNGYGVTGVGNLKLHITRGLDQYSSGYESDVRRAVNQCVNAGAKVISISLGSSTMSDAASELYTRVVEEYGIMIVAASGNQGGQGKPLYAYPASHPSVISVAAVYEWGDFWENSNYSDQVELAAPGHQVLSTSVSTSAVHASDFSYSGDRISGAPAFDVSGILVNCGPGNYQCFDASGAICLIVLDETDLGKMIANCEAGGGIGAVIFDSVRRSDGVRYRNWFADSNIPAIGVQNQEGVELVSRVGSFVTLGLSINDDREYSYRYLSGTSMATPHVAAVAALVWSHFPECTNHQIRHALMVTARDEGAPGCDWDYGYGIVQAKDAYDFLSAHSCTAGNWWQPSGDDTPVCEWDIPDLASFRNLSPSEAPVAQPTAELAAQTQAPQTSSSILSPYAYPSIFGSSLAMFFLIAAWL
jgi:subtilisin family serine protease